MNTSVFCWRRQKTGPRQAVRPAESAGAGAVLEWDDGGACIYGPEGEKLIDCLGGFGLYTCPWALSTESPWALILDEVRTGLGRTGTLW